MTEYIYDNWAERLGELSIWEDQFQDFADCLTNHGALHDNLIGFVDGKFMEVCRPGGDKRN
eukprot:1020250-Rhodomonas_salina.1